MAAYVAVVSLKQKIATIIEYWDVLLPPPLLQILEFAQKELKSFHEFLESLDSTSRKRMDASLGRIAEATREFDDVFASHWRKLKVVAYEGVHDLKHDIHSFIGTLKKMQEEYSPDYESVSLSRVDSGGNKSKMVGLCDEYSKLKEEIIGGRVEAPVFSLVGMAGIGKTTLAKKLFEDLDLSEWLNCRAWVTVGRKCQLHEIPQRILAQVDPGAHEMLAGGFMEVSKYLNQSLKGKRYLIVLDDVWDTRVMNYLKSAFPKNKNGSRVLVTTRKRYVAYSACINCVRLLNKEESWHLLRDKVFGENSCPLQLEEAGKKIAEKCDGLPLTIITVADLLSKAEKTQESLWIEVATQKKHQLFIDAYDEISKVLYSSFEDLHEDFKLCFLYMGVFPQNYEIPRSKLYNLWVAEEVISLNLFETLEHSAEKCFLYLDFSSLVMVHQISTRRLASPKVFERIKTCSLHSSWRHFCQKEARKNNFFHVLDSYRDALGEGIKRQSRLSIYNNVLFAIKDVHNAMEEYCAFTAHSLLCLGPYHQYSVPICFGLKLLQKLDALNIRFYEFPMEVLELIKLRYLALTCNGKLPSSICKLLNLQFLIVNRHLSIKSCGTRSCLPVEIWDMKQLKHLQVMGCDLPDLGHTYLPNLLTLSDVSNGSCTKGVFNRIPKLKKLGIRIELASGATEPLCFFDHICHLIRLESLKCVVVNPKCKSEVVAPPIPRSIILSNVKKLCLSGLGYPWKEINKISSLPHLEVLKLRRNAFEGPSWEIEENGFHNLYFLLIEDMDLVQLKGGSGSFKSLEYLSIKHCYKLKELHLRDGDIVRKVEVVDCNPLVVKEIRSAILQRSEPPDHPSFHSSWNE